MTALSLYFVAASSSTHATAEKMAIVTGGALATSSASTVGASTGWGELGLGSTLTWAAAGSIGAPSGNGGQCDTALAGNTVAAGTWTAAIPMFVSQASKATTGTMVLRFYKYNTSTTIYTSIGSISQSVSLSSTQTTINFSGSQPAMSMATNEYLYIDIWYNIATNTMTSGGTINYGFSSSATQGVATSIITTPGYATSANNAQKSVGVRLPVRTSVKKSVPIRLPVRTTGNKSVGVRLPVRTNIRKSTILRLVVAAPNSPIFVSVPIRLPLITANPQNVVIRFQVSEGSKTSVPIRLKIHDPSSTYQVLIDGLEVFVIAGSLTVDNTIGRRGSASFTVYSDNVTHYQQYQKVTIYDANQNLIFSGYLDQPKEQKPGFQPSLIHTLTCTDQHFLADKRIMAASFVNKTCGTIAQYIWSNFLAAEGVTVGQIFDGLLPSSDLYPSPTLYPGGNVGLIPQASYAYCKVSEALDSLVTAASTSGIPYYWMIDQYKKLYFVPYTTIINPNVVDGTKIDQKGTPPYVQRQNSLYRNTQYITGGVAQTSPQTENRLGDGVTTAWTMGFQLSSLPAITVNGTAKTVGIKGVDSGKDFYWNKGDATITQDSGGTVLTAVQTLQVVYIGQYPNVTITSNTAQIGFEKSLDGSTGIIESVTNDSSLLNTTNALNLASQLLTRYGVQGTILEFTTLDNSFAPGQIITVNLPDHALNNVDMLVESVSASDQMDGINLWNTVTAVLGPYDVSWIDFFSTILKQPQIANAINIGVSQDVTLLANFTGGVSTSATLSAQVFSCPVVNTTLFPATGLYPC